MKTIAQENSPKVCILLLCYNQEEFIKESLNSCLQQDYKNLKIIISDDSSTDNTYNIVKEILSSYTGTHKILLNRNPTNFGIGKHFSYLMENLVDGELIIMCAGDDISTQDRTSKVVSEWIKAGKPSLISHNLIEIDSNGNQIEEFRTLQYNLQDLSIQSNKLYCAIQYLKHRQPIPLLGAANAYKLESYKQLGTPITNINYEDHLMYFRALLLDGVHYFNEKLIYYRLHNNNYSKNTNIKLHDDSSSILACFHTPIIKHNYDYAQCYQLHKIAVQQWIDYKAALKLNKVRADYELIDTLWKNIIRRHNFLTQANSLTSKLKLKLKKSWWCKKLIREEKINYLKPINAIIFGTNKSAERIINNSCKGFNFIAACNTIDLPKEGKLFKNLKIINLQKLSEYDDNIDCILIASNRNYYKIKGMIVNNTNITPNKIIRIPALLLE